jgi:hypothetical protein
MTDLVLDLCVAFLGLQPEEMWPYHAGELFHRALRFFPVFVAVTKFLRGRLCSQSGDKLAMARTDQGGRFLSIDL